MPLAIFCESSLPPRYLAAQQLATQLALPLLPTITDQFPYWLVITDDRLTLRQTLSRTKPLCVDFLSTAFQYRHAQSSRKNELIAKAVGLRHHKNPRVIDATAGFGRDGFILSHLGCSVHYVERSPIIAALLQDGLDRFSKANPAAIIPTLTVGDARMYLAQLNPAEYPEVIYLDPMFPARQKSALVKKEMRILQEIVGEDGDSADLLAVALQCALRRVVVKRAKLAPYLSEKKPDMVLASQQVRFDIYFPKNPNEKLR